MKLYSLLLLFMISPICECIKFDPELQKNILRFGRDCEELFVVKHKSSFSCESAIYFNLSTNIIRDNCNFDFYYNKTDIIPAVLDG